MPLLSRSFHALRQRHRGFSFSNATSENAQGFSFSFATSETFHASRSKLCRSYFFAPAHRASGFQSTLADGSQCSGRSPLWGCYHSSHASGLRAIHLNAASNYRGLRYQGDISRKNLKQNIEAVSTTTPRSRSFKGILWTLIGANVAVYVMWYNYDYEYMKTHFMVSYENVFIKRKFHTLVTSAFSHYSLPHIVANLMGLYCFGYGIGRMFGGSVLLVLYLSGAVVGSLGHIFDMTIVRPFLKDIPLRHYNFQYTPPALGASGAVSTLAMLYICLRPRAMLALYGVIPVPAAVAGFLIVGYDVYLTYQDSKRIASGSHLGGTLVAFIAFLFLRNPRFSGQRIVRKAAVY